MASRTEHSANPDKFAHVLQQSRWRSSESLVVQYKYFIRMEDLDVDVGHEIEPFERSHYH